MYAETALASRNVQKSCRRPWELVHNLLHEAGWSVGWCLQMNEKGERIWVMDVSKGERRSVRDAKTIGEAVGKVRHQAQAT